MENKEPEVLSEDAVFGITEDEEKESEVIEEVEKDVSSESE